MPANPKQTKIVVLLWFSSNLLLIISILWFYFGEGLNRHLKTIEITETSNQLDELIKSNPLDNMVQLAHQDQVRDLVLLVDSTHQKTKNISQVLGSSSNSLDEDFIKIKSRVKDLNAFPSIKSVIEILSKKVLAFNNYADSNNWRTLSRSSERLMTIFDDRNKFTADYLKKLTSEVNSSSEFMMKTTSGSVLSATDKTSVFGRLRSFETEVSLLENYRRNLETFENQSTRLINSYKSWVLDLAPKAARLKVQNLSHYGTFTKLLISLAFLNILFIPLILFTRRRDSKKQIALTETFFLETAKKLIQVQKPATFDDEFTHQFKEQYSMMMAYQKKRLNFSAVVKETLPLPTLILDSNLKVIWSNNLFKEFYAIDSVDNPTWDSFTRYTNIDAEDPLKDALNSQVSGIYQVQFRAPGEETYRPFEMYVCPTNSFNESRILVMFYPLTYIEKTIQDQARSLTSPVRRTLEALKQNKFDGITRENLKKDFDVSGIDDIFQRFLSYFEVVEEERNGLKDVVDRYAQKLDENVEKIQELEDFQYKTYLLQNDIEAGLKKLGQNLNNYLTTFEKIESVHKSSVQFEKNNNKYLSQLKDSFSVLVEKLSLLSDFSGQMGPIRKAFGEKDKAMEESLLNLKESIQSLYISLRKSDYQGVDKKIGLIQEGLSLLEQKLKDLREESRKIEHLMTKLDLKVETDNLERWQQEKLGLQDYTQKTEVNLSEKSYQWQMVLDEFLRNEDYVIKSLKNGYESLVEMKTAFAQLYEKTDATSAPLNQLEGSDETIPEEVSPLN